MVTALPPSLPTPPGDVAGVRETGTTEGSLRRTPWHWDLRDQLLLLPLPLLVIALAGVGIDHRATIALGGLALGLAAITSIVSLCMRRSTLAGRVPWDWTDIVLFLPAGMLIFGSALFVIATFTYRPRHGNDLLLSVLLQLAMDGASLAAVWLLVVKRRHAPLSTLGLRMPSRRVLVAYPGFLTFAYSMVAGLGWLTDKLFPTATSDQCQQVKQAYGTSYLIGGLVVAMLAPFAEEVVFRGFLFGWLRSRTPLWVALVVSGTIFGAVHAQGALFLALTGVGMLLALVYDRSGSLYPGMLTHATFNAINLYVILNSPCP